VNADGPGNILVQAFGALTVNGDVHSGTGHITLKAGGDVTMNSGVLVSTSNPGTISIDAGAAVSMSGTASVTATGSSARLAAAGDVVVGGVTAADVSIVSGADIVNAPESGVDVTAAGLRLEAESSIGTSSRHLTTSVDILTAVSSTGGIFITESDGVTITSVAVTVTDFNPDATIANVIDVSRADLVTGSDGHIILVTLAGDIVLDDGDEDGTAVNAGGRGNILFQAPGDITLNAAAMLITFSCLSICRGFHRRR